MRALGMALLACLCQPLWAGEWYAGTSSVTTAPIWVEGHAIGVSTDNSKRPSVLFTNTIASQYHPPANVWYTVDVTRWGVPSDALAVFLSGMLIITHGTREETCNLTLALRAPGSNLDSGNYSGQVIEAHVGGGQRSTFSSWVPVKSGRFEWSWNTSQWTGENWPAECSYGLNMSLQAYLR